MRLATIALFLSLPLLAADKEVKPPLATPKIEEKYISAYWEAQFHMSAAQDVVRQRQEAVQKAITALVDQCGKDYALQGDAQGRPVCMPASKPPVEPKQK